MKRVREQIGCNSEEVKDYTGKGICIAVLDSGISDHPDLRKRVVAFKDFTGYKGGHEAVYDQYGHGTHVAGIIGGTGLASKGVYRGVAPQCKYVVGKVLDHKGAGSLEHLCQALSWVLENKDKYDIRILNISIGIERILEPEKRELIIEMMKEVWRQGIVVVASAGNTGPAFMSISPIGEAAEIITVGCHDKDYVSASGKLCETYSSRGPGRDAIKKPDIVAPGTDIISCNEQVRYAFGNYKNAYCRKSGTSMAAPIVTGAAALLLERKPTLVNTEVKRILLQSAEDLKMPWHVQGNGFLDIRKAMQNCE